MANNERIQALLNDLPWYVEEYIEHKRRKLSAASLLNYCHDYRIFFDWITEEQIFNGSKREIPLKLLEGLTVTQMDGFLRTLKHALNNKEVTVNRKLSSLKSLFNYLQNVAETAELKPYLQRNVMAKLEFNDIKEEKETTARKMVGKILLGDECEEFREFIAEGYAEVIRNNKKLRNFYEVNRERDTAIVSLVLGSGLRLSEVVNLDMGDVSIEESYVRVIRKGNKEQFVYFSSAASNDLQRYLEVRATRYNVPEEESALFVAAPTGPNKNPRRLSARSIEKLVEKYAEAFGKPELSVHKLRHSFATRFHAEVNDVPKLRRQLGHSSMQTTMVYTHIGDAELKDAVNRIGG